MHGIVVAGPAKRRKPSQKSQRFGGIHNWDAEMEACQFGYNWKASAIRTINGVLGPFNGSFQGAGSGLTHEYRSTASSSSTPRPADNRHSSRAVEMASLW